MTPRDRRSGAANSALLSAALASTLFMAGIAAPAHGAAPSNRAAGAEQAVPSNRAYIVQLAERPVTAYDGGIAGYAATRPAKGQKIDPNDAKVVRYMAYLAARHDSLLAGAGGGRKLYSYGVVFNGFAADLSPAQAAALAKTPGVLTVEKDVAHRMATSVTPSFLGLTGPSGFWSRTGATGEGVIIGVVDSGIWPEHPSFSDRTDSNGNASKDGKLAYQQIPGWHGRCVPGEAFHASHCNQKLIGARWFNAARGGNAGIDALSPEDFNSARDFDSHGTHVAAIAAGNANVAVTGAPTTAESLAARVSGIAPRARIAVYKATWDGWLFLGDILAAIDQAVADGVDVINYSAGSTGDRNFANATNQAFLRAAEAGVFVSAAAGNDGPVDSLIANIAPWVTTVAAGTHNREARGTLTTGNGLVFNGRAAPGFLPSKPLINATAAGLPGADPAALAHCFGAADGVVVLDPAKVAGKIVVCDRGESDRVNKSLAVKQAGGAGMVLLNTDGSTAKADLHSVPTVNLSESDRAAVKAYAATFGASAAILGELDFNAPAPFTAFFSSRGPLIAGGGDLLKPDIMAPGLEVLAAVPPDPRDNASFLVLSGTSMATPHIAGIAALFKQLHPSWSPMAIKSALMTSASDVLDATTEAGRIFRQGAGHVRPNLAINPGVVFDAGISDWLGFLCGVGNRNAADCAALRIDPSDLNLASIAIGDMAGIQTVRRRLTNVSGNPASFNATLSGLSGFSAVVNPSSLSLAAGQTQEVAITFTRTSASFNEYDGGQLSWSDGQRTARIPVVLRPIALAAPAEVTGSYGVKFGYSGAFTAVGRGLVPSAVTSGTVADDPSDGPCNLSTPNAVQTLVTVPAGTTVARFALFDADVKPGSDLDLCVFRTGTPVGESLSATSTETVSLVDPAPGSYTVVVQGWSVAGTTLFKLHTWLLGSAPAGNMTVTAPAAAVQGQAGPIGIATTGLDAGKRYLGSVAYGGAPGLPAPTIVRIDR